MIGYCESNRLHNSENTICVVPAWFIQGILLIFETQEPIIMDELAHRATHKYMVFI